MFSTRMSSKILTVFVTCLGATAPAWAQLDPGIAPGAPRQPRPQTPGGALIQGGGQPPKTADATGARPNLNGPTPEQIQEAIDNFKIDPKLDQLLVEWEKKSQAIQRLNGNFRLFTYDQVFQSETRSTGKFWYASPDKGRMEFEGADLSRVQKDAKGRLINPSKTAPDGTAYEVKSKEKEIWNCNGSEIVQVYPAEKKYNRVAIPPQFRGESIKESPLPFLFGLRRAEAKERYLMTFGVLQGKSLAQGAPPVIHVVAYPLREQDSREWSRAEVLLDSQTYLPQSIRTFDPAGTSENVYAFSNVEVNSRWMFSDPFKISTTGYTLLHDVSAKPQQPSSIPGGPAMKQPQDSAAGNRPPFGNLK